MTHSTHGSRRKFLSASVGLGAMALLRDAGAQKAKWPVKPIRIVVTFPPGGLTDAYARMYAEQITASLGVPAIVENKPGGGAIIGIDAVAKSPPDGYTLLMTTSGTVWQNRVLYTKLPYNLDKDLTPIAVFPSGPLVVGVSEKVPARNMREFIEFAKSNTTSMGTYAPGSYPHMVADQTNRSEGRGVRPIGVTGPYRSPKLLDVPTLVEQGIPGTLVGLEGGLPLMAPAGTPETVLKLLSNVVVEGANTERAAKLRETFAIPNKPKNLAETRREWARDVPVWIKVAVDLGVKLD